ncbi:AzlC family ABC transporter permease [Leucothrix mucor]|uniref:AzlC family ABC transporter permease n=1 Tax=Leucothrix mucor TaxID=45248 RepID=UPI0003B34FD8|nr:AzlC family ABC transporter permease [Leucothrix mucor]
MATQRVDWGLFLQGARDTLPLIVAAIPFGIVYGAMAQAAGLTQWEALGMSLFVFAGSSQFIAVTLLASAAAFPVIAMTVFIVNLRHMLYSASLMQAAKQVPALLRVPMAFWLTDETYAVVANRLRAKQDSGTGFYTYYIGSALTMYLNWQLCTWIGVMVGESVPDMTQWGLDIAMVVAFIGIVVPALQHLAHWACAATAAVSILLTYDWPHQSGLLFSSLLAIAVGILVLKRQQACEQARASHE